MIIEYQKDGQAYKCNVSSWAEMTAEQHSDLVNRLMTEINQDIIEVNFKSIEQTGV